MDTFQPTDTGYRVQDVVTAAAFLRARRDLTGTITVAGLDGAGVWALFASAVDGSLDGTIADFGDFDATSDEAWVDRYYVPCIRSIGDIRTAAALAGSAPLYVAGPAGNALSAFGAVSLAESPDDASILQLLN